MLSGHQTTGYDKNCNPKWWLEFISNLISFSLEESSKRKIFELMVYKKGFKKKKIILNMITTFCCP